MDSAPPDLDMSAPLAAWLVEHLDDVDAATVGELDRPTGGYSAETLIVPVSFTRDGATTDEQVVLRRETPEPPLYPVQVAVENEIDIQWRVMSALAEHSSVPIAPLLGFESDATVIGSPFFVMGFIPGEIPREDPMYVAEGFYVDAAPEQRTRMIETGIDAMAAVHAVDVDAAGLGWLSTPGAHNDGHRQLKIWRDYAEAGLDGRPHDLMMAAFDRVADELPTQADSLLSWGDARLGNVIWQDFRPGCLTDFEAAALCPAALDVGWWLMFEQWSHLSAGLDPFPGALSPEAQLERYQQTSGRELGDIGPWVLFAAARYAAIVVAVMNRLVTRGLLPADNTLYLEPIAPVLRPLLDT